jgi:hypothetical protein
MKQHKFRPFQILKTQISESGRFRRTALVTYSNFVISVTVGLSQCHVFFYYYEGNGMQSESEVVFDKLTDPQLVKNFDVFYGI